MKYEAKEVQVRCPLCGKAIPVRVKSLVGRLTLSIRCPQCKRVSSIELQDISAAERNIG